MMKKYKSFYVLLFLAVFTLLLTGCGNEKELTTKEVQEQMEQIYEEQLTDVQHSYEKLLRTLAESNDFPSTVPYENSVNSLNKKIVEATLTLNRLNAKNMSKDDGEFVEYTYDTWNNFEEKAEVFFDRIGEEQEFDILNNDGDTHLYYQELLAAVQEINVWQDKLDDFLDN